MKKLLLHFSILLFSVSVLQAQSYNVTLAKQVSYGSTNLSNICGWKSPVDGKEYALVGAANGLSIVDVTNPSSPTTITLISGPNCTWREIKTWRNYAYVTTECGTVGLQIVNLINLPATNLQTATWTPTISNQTLKTIHALHVDTAKAKVYLYGSNIGQQGAIVADLSANPMAPVYLGSYDNRYIHDAFVQNDTMYACHIYQGDCEVVDMTNPAAGVSLADWNTPNNFTHNSWLSADSKTCFTTDETANSFLTAYDVSNLNNVTEIDRIQSNAGSNSDVHNTHILQLNGAEYAVTSWYNDGFVIVDVTRPSNMVEVGYYDTAPTVSGQGEDHCWGVYPFLPSTTIVASDIENGLFVCSPTYTRASYLEGIVYNCNTGNPLSGAQVQIINPPSVNKSSATDMTDAFGKYGVGVSTAGTYTVTVSKQAYVTQTFTVSLTAGNIDTLNVNLCLASAPFSYSGNIFDNATTAGIAGANVHLEDSTIVYDTITDANGNFTIQNMIAGTYNITVGKWGYVTKCFSAQAINSTSTPLSVGLDAGIYDDFSFDFGWTLSGPVVKNKWERAVPTGQYNSQNLPANPFNDVTNDCGKECYATGNHGLTNTDLGSSFLTSPVIDLSSYTEPYLFYTRWKYLSPSSTDTVVFSISNGSSTVVLENLVRNSSGNGAWMSRAYKISSYVTPTSTMTFTGKITNSVSNLAVIGGLDKFYIVDSTNSAVSDISLQKNIIVYPNPSSGEFSVYNLQSDNYNLELYNVFGEKVFEDKIANQKIYSASVNLQSGIYFYRVKNKTGEVTNGKLVIE